MYISIDNFFFQSKGKVYSAKNIEYLIKNQIT